jgi:RND family efflux transporter MFP subunit
MRAEIFGVRPGAAAVFLLAALLFAGAARAQEQEQGERQGPPPARVVTAKAETGTVTPQNVFVGTVYFPEVSDTASEVSGRVLEVKFDEGDEVKADATLAQLDTSLARRSLAAKKASYDEAQASLKRARLDMERIETLYRSESVSEKEFDDVRFEVMELENRAESLLAEVSRLRLEIEKGTIRAPFDGVVMEKHTDRGEWLSPGSPVATVAKSDMVDVIVDVPQEVFLQAEPGAEVFVTVAGVRTTGKVVAAIPRGEVATRTFPVKIRVANDLSLAQGMEATARMPMGKRIEAVIVPRDAVIMNRGQNVIYLAENGQARLVPVEVLAYMKETAAVAGPGLSAGAEVIVKGHERLRPGQPVQPAGQQR